MGGQTLDVAGYELDADHGFTDSGSLTGALHYSSMRVHLRTAGEENDLTEMVKGLSTNQLSDDNAMLEIRNSSDQVVGRISLTGVTIGGVALGVGTAGGQATLALGYHGIHLENGTVSGQDTLSAAQFDGTNNFTIDTFKPIADGPHARDGGANTVTAEFTLAGGAKVELALDGFELDMFDGAGGNQTYSPVILHFGGNPGDTDLVELLKLLSENGTASQVKIEAKNSSDEVTQSLTLTNASVFGEALAAGGGGMDAAIKLLYQGATFAGDNASTQFSPTRFAETIADLGAEAKIENGNKFTYLLTYTNDANAVSTVSVAGYELDLAKPFDPSSGAASGRGEAKPLVVHFEDAASKDEMTQLFKTLFENGHLPSATLEVHDGNNALVQKLDLTDLGVADLIMGNSATDSDAVVAFSYGHLTVESHGENGSGTPVSTQIQVGDTEGATFTQGAIDYAELAKDVTGGTPDWVDKLKGGVQDFFDFVRTDLPQRAIGAATPEGFSAKGGGFSTFDLGGDDLPALSEVPIIGDKLLPYVQNGLNIFQDIEAKILDALDHLPDNEDAAQALADKINGLGIDGVEAQVDGAAVRLSFAAHDAVDLNLDDIGVSLGTDIFGLDLHADVGARITAAANASLLIDVNTGDIEILDNGADELSLGLTAGANFAAHGGLGVLEIDATDRDPSPNEVHFNFGLDVGAGKVQDMGLDDIKMTMDGGAKLDLHVVTTTPLSLLPTIAGNLLIDWAPGGPGEGLQTTASFNDVTLDLGSLIKTLSDVFKPLGDIWNSFPIGTMLTALTEPLPVIDTLAKKIGIESYLDVMPLDHGDGNLSMLDVAVLVLKIEGASDDDPRIKSISEFAKALHAIDAMIGEGGTFDGDLGLIQLGSFNIAVPDNDAHMMLAKGGGVSAFDESSGPTITQTDKPDPDPLATANKTIHDSDDAFKDGTAGREGLNSAGLSVFADGFHDAVGFKLPILDDPMAAVKILLNAAFPDDPVTIVQYDLPALEFGAYYEKFFPVVGPIGAVLAGRVDGRIDFGIGYDTSGLARGGLSDFDKGFYVTTNEFSQGSPLWEPVATLKAGIIAGAALSIGVGSAA